MDLHSTKAAASGTSWQQPEAIEATGKTRVQFDFTPDALQRLDGIKEKTNAATRAETIRNALRLYEWFITEAKPDSLVKIEDKDNQVVSQFRARLLLP